MIFSFIVDRNKVVGIYYPNEEHWAAELAEKNKRIIYFFAELTPMED